MLRVEHTSQGLSIGEIPNIIESHLELEITNKVFRCSEPGWRILQGRIVGLSCPWKGAIRHRSNELRTRQRGQSAEVIAYADKANTQLRSKYY